MKEELEKLKERVEWLEFKIKAALVCGGLFLIVRATVQLVFDLHTRA